MEALQKFLADVSSWYWWISVVLVGLAVNLTSAYLKDPVDAWLAKRSTVANMRRTLRERKFQAHAAKLADDPRLMTAMAAREWRYWCFGILMSYPLGTAGKFVSRVATHPEQFSSGALAMGLAFTAVLTLVVSGVAQRCANTMRLVLAAERLIYKDDPPVQRAIRLQPHHWEKLDAATKAEFEALLEAWEPKTTRPTE